MRTTHTVLFGDSSSMKELGSESVELAVTSPPYPMIAMWDDAFSQRNPEVRKALSEGDGARAFGLMHEDLGATWAEVFRVLRPGGFACINVGDATRKVGGSFRLYPNHAAVTSRCMELGFHPLPGIIWRKQSNRPNKFMGSGMLPAGAYVTQEHEHILVLRKGEKRSFGGEERERRYRSALFWEERNSWFSDIWEDVRGDRQTTGGSARRERSAAFPFELAYRLVSMFSVQGDTVLDPFLGTGTTTLAAMAAARNSVGYEVDRSLGRLIRARAKGAVGVANRYNEARVGRHRESVLRAGAREFKHRSRRYGPVVTAQEVSMAIPQLRSVKAVGGSKYEALYSLG